MIHRYGRTRTWRHVIGAVLLLLTLSATTEAGPLDVSLDPYPVVLAGFIKSSYNAATGDFLADGYTLSLNTGTSTASYSNTKFLLTAKINSAGVASSATLDLGGGTLLSSSSLMNFGFYAVPGGTMEFLFTNLSGSLVAPGVYDPTKPLDVMLTGIGSAFTGSWTTSWSSITNASAAIREDPPIGTPEPSVLILTLVGAGALGARRARRNRRA